MITYYSSMYMLIPAIIFTIIVQVNVSSTFGRYSKVRNLKGITGAQAARFILDRNGLNNVKVVQIGGNMTDNYNPRTNVVNLSESVYGVSSIAAISVACHEVGHALQHNYGYTPIKIRNAVVPAANFASALTWPLVLIGIILLSTNQWYFGNLLFNVGVILFLVVIFFHLVTLPTEYNASKRAIREMQKCELIEQHEVSGAKKVLNAAALTYVAALATAVANLLRLLAMRND